jgi:hypothetical protein
MGITITWDNKEKTIIRHIYDGPWTLEDYYALVDDNYHLIDSVDHRVDIINDLRNMGPVPSGIIPAIRYAAQKAHRNEGLNRIVGNQFVTTHLATINRSVGSEVTPVIHGRRWKKPRVDRAESSILIGITRGTHYDVDDRPLARNGLTWFDPSQAFARRLTYS